MLLRALLELALATQIYGLSEAAARCIPDSALGPPLPDALHALLPDLSRHAAWRDALLALTAAVAAGSILSASGTGGIVTLATLGAEALASLLAVKAFTVGLTRLPSSHPECRRSCALSHCAHNMFSGHNAAAMVLFRLHAHLGHAAARPALGALLVGNALCTLCTRAHYSADIAIAWALAAAWVQNR